MFSVKAENLTSGLVYFGQKPLQNLTPTLYKSVKSCRKSLVCKELVLQMRMATRIGMNWIYLPSVMVPTETMTTAFRRINNNSTKGYNLAFRYVCRTNITPACDALLEKASRYISDARFRCAKSELHGCDDFRKSKGEERDFITFRFVSQGETKPR